jgi:SAM-dependent methyltransferase
LNTLYIHEENVHNFIGPREVVPIILSITNPKSVLDVGCGIGTWLKVFEEHGIADYLGVDGSYVDFKKLKISEKKFRAQDLREYWSLNRKFDLVISLEVAEHLSEANADQFIKILVEHGESIVFSAAIPGQFGQNHLNEQWPEYWEAKFARHGFYFHDIIRPVIWTNDKVEWWYKQNIFLVKRSKPYSLPFNSLSVVHPQLFSLQKQNEKEFYDSLSRGRQGLRLASKALFNALVFKARNLFKAKNS